MTLPTDGPDTAHQALHRVIHEWLPQSGIEPGIRATIASMLEHERDLIDDVALRALPDARF
jgi:hypothetical protein